jgi:putative transcriptional regulator
MAKHPSSAALDVLAATDLRRVDAMTDADIARQIAANPEAAPEIDVRAIRRATGLSQAAFARTYEFSMRTVPEGERGAKTPSGRARTPLRAIKADPEAVRNALALG